jgi:hypothetical protein
MDDERPDEDSELQQQIDDLRKGMAANRADIDSLLGRADEASRRADVNEERADAAERRADVSQERADAADRRADVSQERADAAERRADANEALSADDRRRIGDLEAHVDLDRAMILELQAEGLISQKSAAQLQEALHASRRIGAAIGIVMVKRRVSESEAFLILSRASQNTNRKVRVVADEVVEKGEVSDLPML